ncbi:hypothetical protein [Longimicrobium sp.]|uniref:hypothetical protein n=1 Tax=Longimicrobium sp. TaxID=2029185 RepID=UPI003B3A0D53
MKRTFLNLFALTLILGGAARLQAQQIAPVDNGGVCCTAGDGDKCCGNAGCKADASSCSAW